MNRQNFIENWNSASPEGRENLLRGIKWEPGEISKGRYDEQTIEEMSHLGIGTDKNKLNGTVAKNLIERALEPALEPKIPAPSEGCFTRLFGVRR